MLVGEARASPCGEGARLADVALQPPGSGDALADVPDPARARVGEGVDAPHGQAPPAARRALPAGRATLDARTVLRAPVDVVIFAA